MHQNFGLDQSSVCVARHSVGNCRCHDCDRLRLLSEESKSVVTAAIAELGDVFALECRVLLVDDLHR